MAIINVKDTVIIYSATNGNIYGFNYIQSGGLVDVTFTDKDPIDNTPFSIFRSFSFMNGQIPFGYDVLNTIIQTIEGG